MTAQPRVTDYEHSDFLPKGTIVNGGQAEDAAHSGGKGVDGQTKLGSCQGICTVAKGGFDEKSLDVNSKKIDEKKLNYDAGAQNSNSATYTLCSGGGGGGKCSEPPKPVSKAQAKGWGKNLLEAK